MFGEDFLAKWWEAVKPVPWPYPLNPALVARKRRQRRLLKRTGVILAISLAGGLAYGYLSNAEERSQAEFEKGMRSMRPGAYAQAAGHFSRSLWIWPDRPEAYLNRGIAERSLGEFEKAESDFQQAADLDPGLWRAYDELASLYRARGDLDRAIRMLTRSIRTQPSTEAFYVRGLIFESMKQHRMAIEDYDRAILQQPDEPFVYRARALARSRMGDRSGADADRERADELEHN